ncbi:lysylphosphatidylglycerol synthase domain-containing protein [Streptomyces sp. FXJ1.172]|uniref:lysylphosphatidylglycerol synthase transmembrane domain-containing protein n=1 Tax=Streptomyces sp. FXJ1.172 TaxID=710705 RepID=UPI00133170D3|nr:lysylphosphatidylglycerol synthase domain-containing protein [Streptomyces sp. FXJ1.172]WEO92930.1 lysylphosphatidylglycerol synthase domain-containing protein [Streptomyces sp. FXJ1.172]
MVTLRRPYVRRLLGLASAAAGIALLVLAVPRAAGTQWSAVRASLGQVGAFHLANLAALAGVYLWAYTYVLSASLPGLTRSRALVLNCTGSAVSNVLPAGGAAGVAVTYSMTRRWGHPPRAVAASILVTGVCNVLARLVVSTAGVLVLAGLSLPGTGWAADAGTALLAACLSSGGLWLLRQPLRRAVRHCAPARLFQGPAASTAVRMRRLARRCRHDCHAVWLRSWPRLVGGMAGTLAAQGLLFLACLRVTGAGTGLGPAAAVFAASRLLTQIGITPGGIGVTESAAAFALVALGGAPAAVASSMLLYAAFTHLLEILLGCLTGAYFLLREGRRARRPAAATTTRDPSQPPAHL